MNNLNLEELKRLHSDCGESDTRTSMEQAAIDALPDLIAEIERLRRTQTYLAGIQGKTVTSLIERIERLEAVLSKIEERVLFHKKCTIECDFIDEVETMIAEIKHGE